MKKKIFSAVKYLLLLSIGIGLMYLAFHGQDLNSIRDKIKDADFSWVLLSLMVSVLAYLSRAMRWNMLVHSLGYKAKLKNTFWALMFGYFANLAIPRLGEISRCGALSRKEKIPFNELLGTVVIERVVDLFMLMVSFMVVAILQFQILKEFVLKQISFHVYPAQHSFLFIVTSWWFMALMLSPLVLLVFLQVYFRRQAKKESAMFVKISNLFLGIVKGLKTLMKMENNLLFIFHTLFIWSMYFIVSYVCFKSIAPTSHLDYKVGLFVLAIGGVGMTAPVQGGIGTYHLLVSSGLTLFGIKYNDALSYATIVHSSQTLLVILMGIIAFVYFLKPNKSLI